MPIFMRYRFFLRGVMEKAAGGPARCNGQPLLLAPAHGSAAAGRAFLQPAAPCFTGTESVGTGWLAGSIDAKQGRRQRKRSRPPLAAPPLKLVRPVDPAPMPAIRGGGTLWLLNAIQHAAPFSLLLEGLMKHTPLHALSLAAVLAAASAGTPAQEKFSYTTNWYAQAEHGGFYQALATGLYKKEGLDVSIKMGGPQVNTVLLMAAGQTDCVLGDPVQSLKVWEQGIHAVTVAASFQKDPQVLIGHPGVVNRMEDLKGKTLLVSPIASTTYWPWLKRTYKLDDTQVRPYTFNIQPFIADKNIVQQGYLSSEPHAIEKEAGFKPTVMLLSDHGWPPYSTTIVCLEKTVRERPKAVAAFVKASMQGWKSYLKGDPGPANALIKKDNPNMDDERLAVAIRLLNQAGMVFGGDAATQGVGIVTDARMKATYDMLVAMKLLDPAKVDLARTYTTEFVRHLKVMP
jgi:NitT/TauT family transport system substrate-binding protein